MSGSSTVQGQNARTLAGPMVDSGGVALNRLPGLAPLMTRAALALGDALQPLLETPPRASFDGAAVTSVAKFLARHAPCSGAILACRDLDARLFIAFSETTSDILMRAIFGGASDESADAPSLVEEGSIEQRVATEYARGVARVFEATLGPTSSGPFELERLLRVSDANAADWRDAPAVEATFVIATAGGDCFVTVLLPQAVLQAFRDALSQEAAPRPPAYDPQWSQLMSAGVSKAPVDVTAILEELEMTLGDVAALRVGHVVELRGGTLGRVRLECAGQGVFWGALHQNEHGYRVEIQDLIDDEADVFSLPPTI